MNASGYLASARRGRPGYCADAVAPRQCRWRRPTRRARRPACRPRRSGRRRLPSGSAVAHDVLTTPNDDVWDHPQKLLVSLAHRPRHKQAVRQKVAQQARCARAILVDRRLRAVDPNDFFCEAPDNFVSRHRFPFELRNTIGSLDLEPAGTTFWPLPLAPSPWQWSSPSSPRVTIHAADPFALPSLRLGYCHAGGYPFDCRAVEHSRPAFGQCLMLFACVQAPLFSFHTITELLHRLTGSQPVGRFRLPHRKTSRRGIEPRRVHALFRRCSHDRFVCRAGSCLIPPTRVRLVFDDFAVHRHRLRCRHAQPCRHPSCRLSDAHQPDNDVRQSRLTVPLQPPESTCKPLPQ